MPVKEGAAFCRRESFSHEWEKDGRARLGSTSANGASAGIAAMILSTLSLPINSSDVNRVTRRDAAAKQITFRSALILQHDLAS